MLRSKWIRLDTILEFSPECTPCFSAYQGPADCKSYFLMNPKLSVLTAALGLIVSALPAQSADIPISSLPFAITAPGTYVVTGNLSYAAQTNTAAISIATNISGPVILDLKGFSLTGNLGNSVGVGIGVFAGTFVPNAYPITIRNGTLQNFSFGVCAENNANLTGILVKNITFITGVGVLFSQVKSSNINYCNFSGGSYGIEDELSAGGNSYNNDIFTNTSPLFVSGQNGGISSVLDHCQFGSPKN